MEINPVPSDILYKVLEESVCKALTLTGINVSPSELRTCHLALLKEKGPRKGQCKLYFSSKLDNSNNRQPLPRTILIFFAFLL